MAWNAAVTQNGAQVSATNASYNGTLATNASTSCSMAENTAQAVRR